MVSLYSFDVNSMVAAQALKNVQSSTALLLSTFAELEVVNALELRQFRKQMSAAETRLTLHAFDEDLRRGKFEARGLPDAVFLRGRQLSLQTTARLGNRTSDLFHVAIALELGADSSYSFDKKQRSLAEAVQLRLNL